MHIPEIHTRVQTASTARTAVPLPCKSRGLAVHNCIVLAAGKKIKIRFPQIHTPNSNRVYLKK
jgi:hypothetical protein